MLRKVSIEYPELNTDWLLTGEGEMLRDPQDNGGVQNQYGGEHNQQSLTVTPTSDSDKFIELLKKKDEQIDRLIAMLERKMGE